jgi:hypothetical protein
MSIMAASTSGFARHASLSASLFLRKEQRKTARKQRLFRCYFGRPSLETVGFPPKMRGRSL